MISKRTNDLLACSLILIFGMIAAIRLYPYQNELAEILNGPLDDWKMYAQTALDIHSNGLSIPSVNGDYDYPNGFLYNYFLAICFSIFGTNTTPIYIIQSCFVGLSIFVAYKTFREHMRPMTGMIFLIVFFLFGLLDMNKYYSFRFLSENLIILLLALFFYQTKKAIETESWLNFLSSGMFLGLGIMTRPNLFPIALLMIMIFTFYTIKKKINFSNYSILLTSFVICSSILALRNLSVTGNMTFFPVNSFTFFKQYFTHPDLMAENIFHKLLFTGGYLSFINPVFQWRPHWTILWIIYFIYSILKIRKKENFEIWEKQMHLFILSYAAIMIFVIDTNLIGCYGFRYILPLVFTVLPFAFLSAEKVSGKREV